MRGLRSVSKSYLARVTVVVLGLLTGVAAINCVVDPLWHFNGNMVTGISFPFDERASKMNRFLKHPSEYDCYIFGSSRTRMLNESRVEGHRCYNFSFAMGRIGDFLAYASYIKKRGHDPKLVIVGVDDFNFLAAAEQKALPAFIAEDREPPHFLMDYLTLDALEFSVRTLLGWYQSPQHYQCNFLAGIFPSAGVYESRVSGKQLVTASSAPEAPAPQRNHLDQVASYQELMRIFPDATFVFYVPPVSVWFVERLEAEGNLATYLQGIHGVSQLGAVMYDFSIPSAVTADPSGTYDGEHYYSKVNDLVVDTINSGNVAFGTRVDQLGFAEYKKRYLANTRLVNTVENVQAAF